MSKSTSPAGSWLGALGGRMVPGPGGSRPDGEGAAVELVAAASASKPPKPAAAQPQPVRAPPKQRSWDQSGGGGSSGTGLPSALSTPRTHGGSDDGEGAAAGGQEHHSASEEQQDDSPSPGSKGQQRVRWLPGLEEAGSAAASNPALGASGANTSDSSGAPAGGGSHGDGRGSSRHAGRLPPSGDEQLDRYLHYLLHERHPHKFMYYAGWGLTEDGGCAALGEFLRRDRRIRVCTLSDNNITNEGVELIAEGLAHNSTLVSLDLSSNAIGNDGAVALAEALHSDRSCLAELQLSHNRIGAEGVEALAAAVSGSSCLRKLTLTGNPVSAAQLQVVAHVLKTREYKVPSEPRSCARAGSSSSSPSHMRKASSLQFDCELELGEVLERSSSSASTTKMRHKDLLHLPPAVAVSALTELTEPLESSIAMQAAHLLSELGDKAQQRATGPAGGAVAAGGSSSSSSDGGTAAGPRAGADQHAPHELVVLLALRLAARGYEVVLRTCWPTLDAGGSATEQQHASPAGGGVSATGLRHTFVRVRQPGTPEHTPAVVVDPFFTAQFVMPHPTQRYSSVLDALPRVLCLAEPRLWHLVEMLCSEMAAAFKSTGLSLPPWRSAAAMHDKFLSLQHHDVEVDADSSVEALRQAAARLSLKG